MSTEYLEELEKLHALRERGALSDEEFEQAKAKILEQASRPAPPAPMPPAGQPDPQAAEGGDVIGLGRYILSFVLAGFIGLGIAYLLRARGWLAIWINAAIFILLVIILIAAGS